MASHKIGQGKKSVGKVVCLTPCYSASRKYLQCWTFSTFCYVCYSLISKWNKFIIFFKKIYKQYLLMTIWNRFVWNLCQFIKNQKSHVHTVSIHSLYHDTLNWTLVHPVFFSLITLELFLDSWLECMHAYTCLSVS